MNGNPLAPLVIVAGLGLNDRAIGNDNQLLWHIPDDLKRFSSLTRYKPIIMGRKTFESIVQINGGPLKKRENIVVTRDRDYAHRGAIVAHSLVQAIAIARDFQSEEIHIGGGAELYAEVLPQVDRLFLTFFHDRKPADAFFPSFEAEFRETERHGVRTHNDLKYEWVDYTRITRS